MHALQGSWPGYLLDDSRTQIYGWTAQSFTGSTNTFFNSPVVWNDFANNYMLQQHWTRLERAVVTTGTEPTFGYKIDLIAGTDYRYTIMRDLLNAQLENAAGRQNFYGVDPVNFYVNAYVPTLLQGTEFRAGRLFTPFGVESVEAVSTPLMSRSYAFNWCPPFTHMGVQAVYTLSPEWAGTAMLANGNDVFFGPAQEARFVGTLKYVHPNKKDAFAVGTSVGRGKFNAAEPYEPATVALPYEPAGRNNINVFDFVWTRVVNPRLTYNFEAIYGYQTNVPANVAGGIIKENAVTGTAHWGSLVHYLFVNFTPRLSGVLRFETFDDFQGQRTGFEGLYTAVTWGVQFRPRRDIAIRPEIRYDYNGYSRPFEGKHDILTCGCDAIVRW
jgi:hypothetical protein